MEQVLKRLWIGDAPDGREVPTLQAYGITAVFNATPETDNWPDWFKTQTPYLRLNQNDGESIPLDRLDTFVDFFTGVYEFEKRTVLVHCGAGVSRASAFTIFALMLFHNLEWDDAEALVRRARPQISPHSALKQSILGWMAMRKGE